MISRKPTKKQPTWLHNLQQLLDERGMNPRQLSLLAGLNPTAVRDMFSGRARYPRYDTLQAIAKVLETTPAFLMGDAALRHDMRRGALLEGERIELLTEIIARLQETADEMQRTLPAKELARMATTLYQQILTEDPTATTPQALEQQTRTLVSYATQANATPVMGKARRA